MNWRRHKDIGANSKPYLYDKNDHEPCLIEANGCSTRVSSNFLHLCVGLLPNQNIGRSAYITSMSRQMMPNWKTLDLTLILTSKPTFLSVRLEKKCMRTHSGMRPMQKPILLERSTGFRTAAAISARQTAEICGHAPEDRHPDAREEPAAAEFETPHGPMISTEGAVAEIETATTGRMLYRNFSESTKPLALFLVVEFAQK